jgi:glycosyltransferase involved in cell wall biosynthesis
MKSLSVVIPAYNEEENVQTAAKAVSDVMQKLGIEHEILLVNDGSKDRTEEVARSLEGVIPNFKLVSHNPNRGYGGALKAGFAAASKEWVVFYPADNQFDFAEISKFISKADEADLISGYRVDRQDHFMRKVNAFGWNMVVRLLFGYLCRDIDCGFKMFRRDLLEHVHIESNGAMIDTEFLAGVKARGYKITEVPVTHLPRLVGEATGAKLRVILKAFRDLFRFRLRLWREIRSERK